MFVHSKESLPKHPLLQAACNSDVKHEGGWHVFEPGAFVRLTFWEEQTANYSGRIWGDHLSDKGS